MFGRSIKLFKVFGFEVSIDMSWIIIVILIVWSFATETFPYLYHGLSSVTYWQMAIFGAIGFFFSLIFHELCHSLFARKFGTKIRGITLFVFGGVAQMEDEPKTPKAEFVMAIAGPLSSVFLAVVFRLLKIPAKALGFGVPVTGVLHYLGSINMILAIFNMIPAFPLDGGRVLRSILWYFKKNILGATKIASRIAVIFSYMLMAYGFFMFLTGEIINGIWAVLIGFFLQNTSNSSYEMLLLRSTLKEEKVRKFMIPPVTIESSMPLNVFLEEYVYKQYLRMFPVIENGQMIGCADVADVRRIPRTIWPNTPVKQIIRRCSTENSITPEDSALTALIKMNQARSTRLLVIEKGQLVGMINLKDINKFIAIKKEVEEK